MNTYLDIGVTRIQTYLARSKRLRAHARASGGIAQVSQTYSASNEDPGAALAELLGDNAEGWRFNEELGKVDGVVSLVCQGRLSDEDVRSAAGRALEQLRRRWPGADLNAVWGSGIGYTDAYRDQLGPALSQQNGIFTAAPAPELPLARPCQLCEQDAAVDEQEVIEEELELCADCLTRGVHLAGGTAGQRAITADDVASRGDPKRGANHLGTVLMDGNAIGGLFDAMAEADPEVRHGLSKALAAATQHALTTAQDVLEDPQNSILVHVAGGDDVLASVPADQGWTFTRRLLAEFERATAAEIGRLLGADPADRAAVRDSLEAATRGAVTGLPSAAAGLVVHHKTFPFALVVQAAQRRLADAKQAARGAEAAVAWTNLTIDGDVPPTWRQPWLLRELEETAEHLTRLAGVAQSARHAAARLIDPDQPATSWCRLVVHLERFGPAEPVSAAIRPFLDEAVPARDPDLPMTRVLDALTIAGWWE